MLSLTAVTPAYPQAFPAIRYEVADESLGAPVIPGLSYMKQLPWLYATDTHPFIRDSLFQVVARTYYMNRDNFDGTRSQAWAGGGWLAYRSGLLGNFFGVHAAVYTSQRIYGPFDESGTKLLNPEQEPLNVLGQAYARFAVLDQEVRAGRQLVDTPLINPQDNRMVPNTFEGAQLTSLPDKNRIYDYSVGYLWNIKQRDSNDFIPMSDALAGGDVINHGAAFGMLKVRPIPGLSTAFSDYYISDFINTGFAQVEYTSQLPKNVPQWFVGANIIDQRSVGAELLAGSPFQTYQFSAKAQVSYVGWIIFVAGSVTGDESKIFSPFGTKPNYTDMQQVSFDNAGEQAFGGSVAYDFSNLGLPGFTAGAWYTKGWGAINPATNTPIADRRELDFWLQYRPTAGPFQGLRVKVQYGNVRQDDNVRDNQPEFRFIVDYTMLFRNMMAEAPALIKK